MYLIDFERLKSFCCNIAEEATPIICLYRSDNKYCNEKNCPQLKGVKIETTHNKQRLSSITTFQIGFIWGCLVIGVLFCLIITVFGL